MYKKYYFYVNLPSGIRSLIGLWAKSASEANALVLNNSSYTRPDYQGTAETLSQKGIDVNTADMVNQNPDAGGGDVADQPAPWNQSLEQQTAGGAFNRFLGDTPGLGINDPRTAARTFARGQFNPNFSAFLGSQLGGSLGGEAFDATNPIADRDFGNEFLTFLGGQGGTFDPRQRLADAFRSITTAAQGTGGGEDTFISRSLNPQNEFEARTIANLGRNLQSSSVSSLLSRLFQQPTNTQLFDDFRGGGGSSNFRDFVSQRFGLGQLGF